MKDILKAITEERMSRGWSEYELSEKSGLPQSTISSWYRKNLYPTIPSLFKICNAFNISLSDFLSENENKISLNQSQEQLLKSFNKLTKPQQQKLIDFLKTI